MGIVSMTLLMLLKRNYKTRHEAFNIDINWVIKFGTWIISCDTVYSIDVIGILFQSS